MRKADKGRFVYMHTLDSEPAQYWSDEQICFVGSRGKLLYFAANLRQLRREQRASDRWRVALGMSPTTFTYGYIRVRLPK